MPVFPLPRLTAATALLLVAILWTPLASANSDFAACAACHTDIANSGPDHGTHAAAANNDCAACHGGGGFNNPPLSNCVQCHGRDQDAGGDNISAGIGRGLRQHHEVTNAAACGSCHADATGAPGVGEDVLPSFYTSALNSAGLDSCDGSEERFPSNSVSLDNDGDGQTDAADSDCAPANTIPVANAGADQTVNVGDTVTLDGSGSTDGDGDALTYSWSLSTPGGGAVLSNPNAVSPTFVPDVEGVYAATLIVGDGTDLSAPDSAFITAEIVVVNTAPAANAGPDQTVATGATVSLNGSGSSDADGDPLTFRWSLTAVPVGSAAVLSDPAATNPNFVADLEGSYVAQLIVNDGTVDSPADSVIITSQTVVINTPPIANAGPDQNTAVGDVVVLDGSASTDAEGNPLSFRWSLTSVPPGSGATLSDATAVSATFVADLAGDYVAQLIVNDGEFDSAADAVLVMAQVVVVNTPPVANAGLNQSILVGATATLDGGSSTDADGDPLTFSWSLSVPAGSSAVLSDAAAAAPSFVADVAGTYVAQLIVNDGLDDSAPDSAVIVAAPPLVNQPPVANAGANQTVVVGDTVSLNGGGSSDPDNDAIVYRWSLINVPVGSSAALSEPAAVAPTFAADVVGDYVAQLIVSDGEFDSAPDTVMIRAQVAATGGELLYNQNCGFCHGDPIVGPAVDATLAGLRRVTGSRVCTIEASIFGNHAGERGEVRFPDGVPEMQYLQSLSFGEMQQIADYLNSGQVSGERRYVSNCAGCHGNDGSGGFVGEDVRGEGHETWHAISEESSMNYLGCLTGSDVDQIAAFLGNEDDSEDDSDDDDEDRRSGGGAAGPAMLLLLGLLLVTRRRRVAA
jgi:mono/diheme cytochrome c family protein